MILYQDLKWLLGVLEENKNSITSINSKNYEDVANSILEDNNIKSVSINNKINEWNKDHNSLKEELEVYNRNLNEIFHFLL